MPFNLAASTLQQSHRPSSAAPYTREDSRVVTSAAEGASARYFIYARKSTRAEDRQARSIEDQLSEVRDLAQREGLHIVDIYRESRSAKAPGRPVFDQMLARLERGEANGLLAWHPDRLARNMLDGGRIIHLLDFGTIKCLRFPTVQIESGPQGKLMLSMFFGMGKYYVDNLSENIRRGQRQRLRAGVWPMMAPLGYLNDPKTRRIVSDPKRGPLIRQLFELYATGHYSLEAVGRVLTERGLLTRYGKPLVRAQIHRILQNPIYYGLLNYGSESYEGSHAKIVSKGVFDRVQAALLKKAKPKAPQLKPYAYRGLFRCGECGCFITTETHKGYNYLRCTKRKGPCSQPYLREEEVDVQITEILASVSVGGSAAEWLVHEFEIAQIQEAELADAEIKLLREELRRVDEKVSRLMTAYSEEAITLSEFRQAKAQQVNQKIEIAEKIDHSERHRDSRFEPAITFVKAAKYAGFLVSDGKTAERADFFRKIGSNYTLTNGRIDWTPSGVWKHVVTERLFGEAVVAAPLRGAAPVDEIARLEHLRRIWDKVRLLVKDNTSQ
jgi:site-specific DNA recombinase